MSHKIVLTGGGTAGHVTPNIALIEAMQAEHWHIDYIGSGQGIEKHMIEALHIPFHAIQSGKLRRYLSWNNVLDPFKIAVGIYQSYRLLRRIQPDVVFSKGGFVAFPVVLGAWLNRIPVVAHESDLTPGLANRLSFPFVDTLCITFAAAKPYYSKPQKVAVTGTPIRQALLQGNKSKGLALCGFKETKPCLLVIGGSQGAHSINRCVRQGLDALTEQFQVIHLCGKGKVDSSLQDHAGYYQMEYATSELADLIAASDMVISRAGANALYEMLTLKKPHVLVPLSKKASRGDQIENAHYFQSLGISVVVDDDTLTSDGLLAAIAQAQRQSTETTTKINSLGIESATSKIMRIIKEKAHVKYASTI